MLAHPGEGVVKVLFGQIESSRSENVPELLLTVCFQEISLPELHGESNDHKAKGHKTF